MFSRIIPKQRKMSTRVGGFLILISETMFLFSILNFLMISRLQYYSSGDSYIRAVFPHYLFFLGAMGFVGLTAMFFIYTYILPSKQRFSQEQAVKDSRSPTYNKLLEVQEELSEMRMMMADLSEKVEKLSKEK
ncbi:hypothetical protein MSMTP_2680 [Methanosarcina sp. MTP4]|uniref:hypothetical protein n=1 Tax=Methanosarcina sp. MTP4 TaxID=1434100 RepID=UPI000615CD3E|nr:hypothetical protein [Methanosarcina sp. MTP4]AKB26149.1 hypothetical protein MSMTP_2680 [Methanosarcina sp. MTP4]